MNNIDLLEEALHPAVPGAFGRHRQLQQLMQHYVHACKSYAKAGLGRHHRVILPQEAPSPGLPSAALQQRNDLALSVSV